MSNPLTDIEDAQAQHDIGVLAARVYNGALAETDNRWVAFWATVAFFVAQFKQGQEPA